MEVKIKEYYGKELEKNYLKIEYRVSYRVTEVNVIIREKEANKQV